MTTASFYENLQFDIDKPQLSVLLQTAAVKEIRIIFKAGQAMKAHKAPAPIVVAVMKGCIDFGVGMERVLLQEGMIIALEADVVHDLIAEEDCIVRLSIHKALASQ
jgi:quercetin dioxygenase-like cupin family protein